jgi:hypothetical protein
MCGKCGKVMGAVACGSQGIGALLILLGAISRMTDRPIMGHSPWSFAAAAALMLLLSISMHCCKMACMGGGSCKEEEPHTH